MQPSLQPLPEGQRKCWNCGGSAKMMGGGCIWIDCLPCGGKGYMLIKDIGQNVTGIIIDETGNKPTTDIYETPPEIKAEADRKAAWAKDQLEKVDAQHKPEIRYEKDLKPLTSKDEWPVQPAIIKRKPRKKVISPEIHLNQRDNA